MSSFRKQAKLGGLVMTRREGEKVVINHGELEIEVVEISGKSVRIAFKAHKEINIRRGEVSDCADGSPTAKKP